MARDFLADAERPVPQPATHDDPPLRLNPDPNHEPDPTCPCSFCVWVADGFGLDTPNLRPTGGAG